MPQILQIYNTVMVLSYCQNVVSTQYLEKEWMEFDQIFHMHLTSSRLGLLHVSFHKFTTKLWPFLMFEFCLRSISCEQIVGIRSNFAYALTSSRLGLLHVNFHKFTTQLWPSIIVRISFLLNILRRN